MHNPVRVCQTGFLCARDLSRLVSHIRGWQREHCDFGEFLCKDFSSFFSARVKDGRYTFEAEFFQEMTDYWKICMPSNPPTIHRPRQFQVQLLGNRLEHYHIFLSFKKNDSVLQEEYPALI